MNFLLSILGLAVMVIFLGVIPTLILLVGDLVILGSMTFGVPWWAAFIMALWLYLIVLDIRHAPKEEPEEP